VKANDANPKTNERNIFPSIISERIDQ
jgi:hypothetical protein